MINENNEIWKPIKGFEGLYEVSSLGRVKSVERTCKGRWDNQRRVKEHIINPFLSGGRENNRYYYVNLSKNGVYRPYGVHVVVALAFPEICGLPFEGADVNHINENHFDNRPENLNFLSHPDNLRFGTGIERRSKIVYQYEIDGKTLVREWTSTMEVQRQTGYWQATISACCRNCYNPKGTGAHNVYKGFIWSYIPLT